MIHDELKTRVYEALDNCTEWTIAECDMAQKAIESATTEQLWTLWKKRVEWKIDYRFLPFDSNDHIALTHSGMYIALLPDGSTHT
jgi:hypothetical protein